MKKDLPKVYANPINKPIMNNKEIYVSTRKSEVRKVMENIPQKINEIFASPHHVYKSKVRIITNNDELEATIVGKTYNYLLTLSGERININNIEYIERI